MDKNNDFTVEFLHKLKFNIIYRRLKSHFSHTITLKSRLYSLCHTIKSTALNIPVLYAARAVPATSSILALVFLAHFEHLGPL